MIKYEHFALDNLFLTNGYREMRSDYGIEREYDREEELEQCIRLLVLRKSEPLRGWDLRFLRRGLELSQADFGKMIDRDAQTVARWEKSSDIVPKFVDMMIRARFAERFEPQMRLAELLSFSDGTAPALPSYIQLSLTENGWKFNFELRINLPLTKAHGVSYMFLPVGHGPVQPMIEEVVYSHSNWRAIIGKPGVSLLNSSKVEEPRNLLLDVPKTIIKSPSELLQTLSNKPITASGSTEWILPKSDLIPYSATLQ